MSNLANPSATVDFVYESVDGVKRVPIKAKFLSDLECDEYDRLKAEMLKLDVDDPECKTVREKMIRIGIVSPPYEELLTLTRRDVCEIALRYPIVLDRVELDRLGKLNLLQRFTTALSAADAAVLPASTNPADNATPPASPTPSV